MRSLATVVSFFAILGLYFLYGWVAVPLFLPTKTEVVVENDPNDPKNPSTNPSLEALEPYLFLLPEKEWELNPNTDLHYLQSGDTIILFGKDTFQGKTARLEPCTVLMVQGITDNKLSEDERQEKIKQAIVLRAPLYAEIEFDKEFNLTQLGQKMPNIVGCKLFGSVTIQSAMKDGPDDDLRLETENINITESPALTRIVTLKDVKFQFGPHHGIGSMLSMELTPSNPKDLKSQKTLNRVQFEKLRELQLVFDENDGKKSLVDVLCQREFVFRNEPSDKSFVASFLGNAEIIRNNPDGTKDTLNAEEVHIKFQEDTSKVAAKNTASKTAAKNPKQNQSLLSSNSSMQPVSFVANGRLAVNGQTLVPVRLNSPQGGGVQMVGDRILYDIKKNRFIIETQNAAGASKEVEAVLQNLYHIRCEKSLQYTIGQPNEVFGVLSAGGKGTLRGNIGDAKNPKNLFLAWNVMQIAPCPVSKDQILVQLWNGVNVEVQDFGKMTGDKLDFWLRSEKKTGTQAGVKTAQPKPASGVASIAPADSSFVPDRAMVKDKVQFSNDKGVCKVNRMDIFFEQAAANGKIIQSRWIPSILTERPAQQNHTGGNVKQVQWTQPIAQQQPAAASPMLRPITTRPSVVPLYQAQPAQAVANNRPQPTIASPAVLPPVSSVAQQNLFGMNTGQGAYEITGNQMRMLVKNLAGKSNVETLILEGNVVIEEKILNATQGDFVRITGSEVQVWNPSAPDTQIKVAGDTNRKAVFAGRGVEMIAQEINIDRASNKVWSQGAGQLTANVKAGTGSSLAGLTGNTATNNAANNTLAPVKIANSAADEKLFVEWNQEMRFDGQKIQFLGKADRLGNRVRAVHQDRAIWCDIMELHLNRVVSLFDDDKTAAKPQGEMIQCAGDVYVISTEYDAMRQKKSADSARFAKLRYQIANGGFVAEGPGVLRSTQLGSDKGFTDTKAKLPAATVGANAGKLNYLSVWFQNYVRGTFMGTQRNVEIQGRVQAVYCPVNTWDDVIDIENLSAARHQGYIMECETLQINELPDPTVGGKLSAELTASGNATIDGSKVFGSAKTIKYNQAKSTVIFDGSAKIHTTENGRKSDQSAEMIQYNTETGAIILNQSGGITITR